MRYVAKVIKPGGTVLAWIEREGLSDVEVRASLSGEGFAVLRIDAARGFSLAAGQLDLVLFSHELGVLLEAGISLHDALQALAEKEPGANAKAVIAALHATLRDGKPFSAALAAFPDTFPALYVANVRASEQTGNLATSLARYVEFEERLRVLRRRISGALIYPAILLGAGVLVLGFLMLYVVPRFSRIQEGRNNQQLSDIVAALFSWGHFAAEHTNLILAVLAAMVAAVIYALVSGAFMRTVVPALMGVRPFRDKARLFYLISFYRTVGMLVQSGISAINAIGMSVATLSPELQAAANQALRELKDGVGIVAALERNRLLTGVSARLVSAGAAGGRLAEMLGRSADFHSDELMRWIDSFTKVFEPVVMALIGLAIGTVVVVMYMPIFELAGSLG